MSDSEKLQFITHIALFCRDVAVSKKWYQTVFGMNVVAEAEGRFCALSFGKSHHDIALAQAPNDSGYTVHGNVGLYHISVDVGSYERSLELYEKAMSMDTEFLKIVDHRLGRGVYVRDPDGNVLELWSESYPSYEEAIDAISKFNPSFDENPVGYYLDIEEEVAGVKAATETD